MKQLFVPGRLCLFGEHSDWAGHYRTMNADIVQGAAIVTGIEQGILADVEKSPVFKTYKRSTGDSLFLARLFVSHAGPRPETCG